MWKNEPYFPVWIIQRRELLKIKLTLELKKEFED
jgi:hypothetical protein